METEMVTEAITTGPEVSETEIKVVEAFTEKAEETVSIFSKISAVLVEKLPSIVFALIILIAGIILSKLIVKLISNVTKKSNLDNTANSFLKSFIRSILYTIVIIIALNILGVPIASIITVVGAAGLALSLALQQCLSNIAGGFIILFSKPFKAGDNIEAAGVSGVVENITILYTKIVTPDNIVSLVPNGSIANSNIVNKSAKSRRRLDMSFSISYDSNFNEAVKLIQRVINDEAEKNQERVFIDPAPVIRMSAHGSSSIDIDVKVWVENSYYFDLRYDLNEKIKAVFDENGIVIPYNVLDVHMSSKEV